MAGYITITRKKDRLREKLNRLVPGVNEAISEANEKSATEMVAAMRAAAPEVTGDYKEHLNARPVQDGEIRGTQRVRGGGRIQFRAVNALAWGIFAIFWWKSLEFGSRGKGARPHIFPIYRAYRKRIRGRNTREINKQIKRVAR